MKRPTLPLLGVLILAPTGLAGPLAAPAATQAATQAADQTDAAPDALGKEARPRAAETVKSAPATKDPAAAATPAPLSAQPVADPATAAAATAAATAYLETLKARGFGGAAALLHPSALTRFKTLALSRLKDEETRGSRALLNATFGRTADYATAANADPTDFLTRFGRVISVREPDAAPRFSALAPIGVLREGDRLHVLIRLTLPAEGRTAGSTPLERLEVVTLLPQGSEWKVDLDSRLQSVAANLGGQGPAAPGQRAAPPRFEPVPEPPAPLPREPLGPGAPLPREAQGPGAPPAPPRQPPVRP